MKQRPLIQQMEVVDGYSYAYPNGRECDEDSCRVVSGVTRQ